MSQNIFDEFKWRGLVFDCTEGVQELLGKEKVTLYNGFDPTADSLHIGHLVPMTQLARMQRQGHSPIALAGGGTGMIGDPSGRSSERNLLTHEQIEANLVKIKEQLRSLLDFEVKSNPARLVNNYDWLSKIDMISFLRDVGKHFTVNYMMAKDSVKGRIDRGDEGMSYTEFSYMLLQSYDFKHLAETFGCQLQTGGSDQWGNITAGTQFIRKVMGKSAHAMVYPLITRADGSKFGKTAEGESVWLDPKRTSPYRFYQFFINTEDEKVVNLLNYYTFMTQAEIAEFAHAVATEPHRRAAQKQLAQDVTRRVHGEDGLAKAEKATAVLFGGSLEGLDSSDIADIFTDVPSSELPKTSLEGGGMSLVDVLADTSLANSKGDARRSLKGGAMNVNNERVGDDSRTLSLSDAIEGQFVVLRKGKRKYHLLRLV